MLEDICLFLDGKDIKSLEKAIATSFQTESRCYKCGSKCDSAPEIQNHLLIEVRIDEMIVATSSSEGHYFFIFHFSDSRGCNELHLEIK